MFPLLRILCLSLVSPVASSKKGCFLPFSTTLDPYLFLPQVPLPSTPLEYSLLPAIPSHVTGKKEAPHLAHISGPALSDMLKQYLLSEQAKDHGCIPIKNI